MNWSDERYVRIYTRDTADLIAAGWEGRLVLYELIRKVDRSGVLDTGGDLDVMPDMLRIPAEVFRAGLERLRARGCIRITSSAIVVPNYQHAQEAVQSDRLRQRESRAKRRDSAMSQDVTDGHAESQAVTKRDAVSHDESTSASIHPSMDASADGSMDVYGSTYPQAVTNRDGVVTNRDRASRNVTESHAPSHGVTDCHSVPSRTVPSRTVLIKDSPILGVDGVDPPALELGEPPPPRVTPADLEAVYKLYPRKEGKATGLAKARKVIRTPADLDAFRSAVTNYAELMRREGRELRHVKAFDSFMSCWVDYVDPAVLTPEPRPSSNGRARGMSADEMYAKAMELERQGR